jgi:hypothetical protein
MHPTRLNSVKPTAHQRKQLRQQPLRPPEQPVFPEREAPIWKPLG